MKIYSQLRYTNPLAEPGSPEHTYGHVYQLVLEQRYGVEHLNTYYFKYLEGLAIDEEDFRTKLEINERFPDRCFIMLNLETVPWSICDTSYNPKPEVIAARIELLELAKSLRPDCTFAYYGQPPSSDYEKVTSFEHKWIDLLEASRDLVELQDCLIPEFYFRDVVYSPGWSRQVAFTPKRAKEWATTVCRTLPAMFPSTEVRPIMWPMSWSWAKANSGYGSTDFEWTPQKAIESRVRLPVWEPVLDVVRKECKSLIIWGEGHAPWDANADWFLELIS